MVQISEQGKEIVRQCELKVKLQSRAEELSEEARTLLDKLREISNEQFTILQHMKDVDAKIEFLAESC